MTPALIGERQEARLGQWHRHVRHGFFGAERRRRRSLGGYC
jgi:hypothetical protein